MPILCVNIDHVATLREARKGREPDPVAAAALCEMAGAAGITVHLREDRRHIHDRDVRLLRETVRTRLNLEMAATEEMVGIALMLKPDQVTLVPEKREEVTTEGGLDVVGQEGMVGSATRRLQASGIDVSLFIDPSGEQVKASARVGARMIELHTGAYCIAFDGGGEEKAHVELEALRAAGRMALDLGLVLNAGHGLNYWNVGPVAGIRGMHELNIGHSIMSRAVMVGMDRAVRDMIGAMNGASIVAGP